MQKIVYTAADGRLMVFHPAPNARLAFGRGEFAFDRPYRLYEIFGQKMPDDLGDLVVEDDDTFMLRLQQRAVPADATNVQIVDESVIPADRTFRGAWEHLGETVGVNMPKARDIHRDYLRALRAPKLAALDSDYLRADENGDGQRKRDIAAEKQALRDVTADPAIEAAQTPEELKAVMPAALRDEQVSGNPRGASARS